MHSLACAALGGDGQQASQHGTLCQVDELVRELERVNPTKKVLASPLINAKWKLLYTTSASILGTSRPPFLRPQGPIFQTIGGLLVLRLLFAEVKGGHMAMAVAADAVNLQAINQETWPFFNQACLAWLGAVLPLHQSPHTTCMLLQVQAELTPETSSRVAVQFKRFKILGLLPIDAPPNARGKLDTTYLDDTLRV